MRADTSSFGLKENYSSMVFSTLTVPTLVSDYSQSQVLAGTVKLGLAKPLSLPVGFAMEATATGAPGLPGRTGLAAVACPGPSLPLASDSQA
jgi:hypothetical protein